MLGIATYTAQGLDYWGRPVSVWTGRAAILGAVYGCVPGLVLGIAVAGSEYRRVYAALLGAGIGLIMAFPSILAFLFTPPEFRHARVIWILVAPIPLGAFLGLVLATITVGLGVWQKSCQAKRSLVK